MDFRLLGTLEARAGDELVPLGPPKQRAVLALLLLNANRVLAREWLIDQLWGEEPPDTAIKALQGYVSRLRRLLPDGMLVTRPPGYLLEVEPDAVDLFRFERLVAEARTADPARASALLGEALGLWRAPPLGEFGEEPFARVEAGRLGDVRLAALEERIEADLALGRHADLIGELELLIAEEPQRERLRGQLMLALYRSGRQAEALEAYRAARAALAELGLEPGPELRGLEKQILTHDRALELPRGRLLVADRVVLPGALVPTPPFPFVGREAELTTLRGLLERAVGGEGTLVLLAAEAGGGKTRLVRELAHEAEARGALVLYGVSDAAVSTPYQPLREWLEFLLRVSDPATLGECLRGTVGEQAARVVPELGRLTGSPSPPSDPEAERYALQSAAAELLGRISRLQPLLLIAEDLHWADGETLQLLRRLARSAPEARMLVLATYRDRGEEIGPALSEMLAELARIDGMTRLSLRSFSDDEVKAFISASADAEAPGELASAVRELTGGAPLLLCELWRDLRDDGAIEVSDAGVRLSRPIADLRGPERLRDVVRQRLSRLAADTAAALELAAVVGPRFESGVLAQAAGLDHRALTVALDEAARHGLVENLPGAVPASRFTHELVRRAVYDRATGIRRAELHLRVGEALEQTHNGDLDPVLPELAHHFTLAAPVGGPERAVDYNLRAADAAVAAAAYGDAADRLTSALGLGIDDAREQARVQLELSFLLNQTGRLPEADVVLAQSLGAATGLEERSITAQALLHRWSRRIFSDPDVDPAQMQTVAEAAIATLDEIGDSRGLAVAEEAVSNSLRRRGQFGAAVAALERALVHADASAEPRAVRTVITSLGGALCVGPTPISEAMPRCEELLRTYPHDPLLEAILTRFLGLLLAMAGRFEEALEHIRRSSLVLDQADQLTASWLYRELAGQAKELAGDWKGAVPDFLAQSLRYRDRTDGSIDERALYPAYQLAHLYCLHGRWDDAADCLSYGADVTLKHPTGTLVYRLAAGARLATHRGELDEALTLAQRGVALMADADPTTWKARASLALAEVQRARGAEAEADAAVAAAIRLYEAKGNVAAAAALGAT